MRVNKKLIFSVFVLVGLTLQWLQGQSSQSGKNLNASESFVAIDDYQPFARSAQDTAGDLNSAPKLARQAVQKINGRVLSQRLENHFEDAPQGEINLGTTPESSATEEGIAAKEKAEGEEDTEENEEDSEEEKEIVGYDEQGNPIYKEKTEEDSEAGLIADKAPEADSKKEEKREDVKKAPETMTYVTGPGGAPAEEEDDKDKSASYDYNKWAELILKEPSYSDITKLIEEYQTGRIAKETFYQLVNDLLADGSLETQRMALLAVGLTPSKESFLILADIRKSLPYNSPLRTEVENFIGQYSTMAYLSIMESILMSPPEQVSTYALILAAQTIDMAAQFYIARAPATGDNSSQGENLELNSAQLQFSHYASVLEDFLQFSPNTEARSVAEQTLTNIRVLLES